MSISKEQIRVIMKEEIEKIIFQYLKENLSFQFENSTDYGYGGQMEKWTTIKVYLGEEIIHQQSF